MTFIEMYALFALATALTALYELVYPVLSFRKKKKAIVEHEVAIYITLFVLFLLIPFLVFFSCVIPHKGVKFRTGLYQGLFKD